MPRITQCCLTCGCEPGSLCFRCDRGMCFVCGSVQEEVERFGKGMTVEERRNLQAAALQAIFGLQAKRRPIRTIHDALAVQAEPTKTPSATPIKPERIEL